MNSHIPTMMNPAESGRSQENADTWGLGRRIRVLHSVGHLQRGGIENWIYQTAVRMDPERFEHQVLVRTENEEPFTRAFREAGIRVIPCTGVGAPLSFYRNFKRVLRENGPYDVVHAHGFSFLTTQALLFAKLRGIRCRVLHAHNDLRPRLAHAGRLYRAYTAVNLSVIRGLSNKGLACGMRAAEWTFGKGWMSRTRGVDLVIGIDMEPFFESPDPDMRHRLLLPGGRFVLAQIARHSVAKNHRFTIEVLRELVQRNVPVHLLLIGDGELRAELERSVIDASLQDRCSWLIDTDQVPAIMRSAIDLQLLPSIHEGLGLVIVEAQAAGVCSLVSESVTREGVIDPKLVRFLPIDKGPGVWADAVAEQLARGLRRPVDAQHCERMRSSRFSITRNVEQLSRIYETLVQDTA
jgi:glycosyltransferase involved in cell wall biosynthesis